MKLLQYFDEAGCGALFVPNLSQSDVGIVLAYEITSGHSGPGILVTFLTGGEIVKRTFAINTFASEDEESFYEAQKK